MRSLKVDLEQLPSFDFKSVISLVDCGNFKYLDWVQTRKFLKILGFRKLFENDMYEGEDQEDPHKDF